ncbi:magnesium transporter [Candidatus Mesenet endosymbiont of Phosphuga atrata]|uniref:magnesium transporter n=1 Tax=Candidatus Mesenet endosymbiont of Phosphuga atrata TaxID=3066221 RepID=UPI0030CCC59A
MADYLSYELDEKTIDLLTKSIDQEDRDTILQITQKIDEVQLAYFLLISTAEHRSQLIKIIDQNLLERAFIHIVPELRVEIINILGMRRIAKILAAFNAEDIVAIVKDLDNKDKTSIIKLLPQAIKKSVDELLSYPEESAGRLIHKDIVIAPEYWNVEQLLKFLHHHRKAPKKFYQIFVVNPKLEPVGVVELSDILCAQVDKSIKNIMKTDVKVIKTGIDQEEVASIFQKYSLLSAPVVNKEGRIIGAILIEDVVNVIQQETEEDIFKLSRVSKTDVSSSLYRTVVKRLPWLLINLCTATLSSLVIGLFGNTLKQLIELSIIMPMIASIGGNAGLQAVTVTIRAITTKQLTKQNTARLLVKELLTGLISGIILAVISVMFIILRFHNIKLEILFGISIIITFTIATSAGAMIPIILNSLRIDPAVSSSILICATTDTLSFLTFLGLATAFLFS